MSIQSEIDRLALAKDDLADAITSKGVAVPQGGKLDSYPALVLQIETGGGGGGNEPVPPSTDGKTRLYITVPASAMEGEPPPRADVPLYIRQTVANGVSIDWGDGSAAETLSGTGNVNTTHHYNAAGDYVIALTVAEGCELGLGWGTSSYCVMGSTSNSISSNGASGYRTTLKMCSIGSGVTSIGSNAFRTCYGLSSVNIPDSVTSIGVNAFYNCYSLSSINIPDSVTSIGADAFSFCYSLSSVNISDSITSIGSNTFGYCYSLFSVNIPDNVTSIGTYAFRACYSLKYVYFNSNTPPAILSNTFGSIADDCIFSIPAGSLSAYQSATNFTGFTFEERAE